MIEHVKYFGKLTALAAWTWLKINLLGFVSLFITFIISFLILFSDENLGPAGHASAIGILIYIISSKPIQSLLLFLLVLSPILLLILSNKYVITKIINRIINDKSEGLLYPLLDKILGKFKTIQPNIVKQGADYSIVKLKLIHQVKNETENKWIKKVLVYGLEKIALNNTDFSKPETDFNSIIKAKTTEALHNITEPSRRNIWLVLGFQWLVMLIIWIMK